jgi:hypothetical protein
MTNSDRNGVAERDPDNLVFDVSDDALERAASVAAGSIMTWASAGRSSFGQGRGHAAPLRPVRRKRAHQDSAKHIQSQSTSQLITYGALSASDAAAQTMNCDPNRDRIRSRH